MKHVYLSSDIRLLDAAEIERRGGVLELVELSGRVIANRVCAHMEKGLALFFCGPGNNGADGIAAALLLEKEGISTRVILVGTGLKPATLSLWERYIAENPLGALQSVEEEAISAFALRREPALVVDAILGTGARFGLVGVYRATAQCINRLGARCPVLAVDVPTGVCGDTGRADPMAVSAHETICLTGYKAGILLYLGADYVGRVRIAPVLESPVDIPRYRYLFTQEDLLPLTRNRNSHKGSYGRLAVIGGSRLMPGSALLTSYAALRSGIGTVTIATTQETASLYAQRITEAMVWPLEFSRGGQLLEERLADFLSEYSAVVVGPGLGREPWVYQVVSCALMSGISTLIDADGLNALADYGIEVLEQAQTPLILTPHPKELGRLMGCSTQDILEDPVSWVERAARKFSAILLLKGATTLVADSIRTVFLNRGNPGMAKGGSGDVLSGVIGAFMGVGYPLEYAAWAGAFSAGMAGEYAAEELGVTYMLPRDTIRNLRKVYQPLE